MENLSIARESSGSMWSQLLRVVSLGRFPGDRFSSSRSTTVPELVRSQAARRPNALAVRSGKGAVSYGELEYRADGIARRLLALGLSSGDIVALWLDRSPEFVCAALGVMKSGCAYLPLDISWPRERVAQIFEDAQVSVVLTASALKNTLPDEKFAVVCVDDAGSTANRYTHRPREAPVPGDLAYLIYTSGSMGKPKGVEITHANLRHLVDWHQREFSVSAADRGSMLASVGFDASVWETWPYLAAGASLQIPDDNARVSPELLRDWLVTESITVSFAPTAMAERLLRLAWPQSTALRFLLTGADVLQRYPRPGLPFALVNNYGPTECTVVTTSGIVPCQENCRERPSIGKPIGETRAYVLDENLRPALSGEIGELYIAGPGVGRGYHNDRDLTRKRFVNNPFDPNRSERMYRSGDLVLLRSNGEIEFIGRADEQLKICGNRVEPNEVRTALATHPAVEACCVAPRNGGSDAVALVAYVVFRSGASATAQTLRAHVRSLLPEFMVPAQFIALSALPLTSAGKVDRDALPAATCGNALSEEPSDGAADIQSRLLPVLEELLLHQVSPNDNFFLLGGHSLLGAQLILRIQDLFGTLLTLRDIFDHPTATGIAAEILRAQQRAASTAAPPFGSSPWPAQGQLR